MITTPASGSFFRIICRRLNCSIHLANPTTIRTACRYRCYSTHYETLGVTKNAKPSDIKNAYIEKTKAHHPDVVDSRNVDKFLKIAEAYEVLRNPRTRREYDFKMFGMSSQYNRFESGEYNIPLYDSPERKMRYEQMKMKKKQNAGKQPEDTGTHMKMTLTPTERKILDYLLGALASICVAMYMISRYQREHKSGDPNENEDSK